MLLLLVQGVEIALHAIDVDLFAVWVQRCRIDASRKRGVDDVAVEKDDKTYSSVDACHGGSCERVGHVAMDG